MREFKPEGCASARRPVYDNRSAARVGLGRTGRFAVQRVKGRGSMEKAISMDVKSRETFPQGSIYAGKSRGIPNIEGLNQPDKERILAIGFDAWLDEVAAAPQAVGPQVQSLSDDALAFKQRFTRDLCTCVVCTTPFYAKRSDAVYCSTRCRVKACRRQMRRNGNVTDNAFCGA